MSSDKFQHKELLLDGPQVCACQILKLCSENKIDCKTKIPKTGACVNGCYRWTEMVQTFQGAQISLRDLAVSIFSDDDLEPLGFTELPLNQRIIFI